LPDHPGGLFGIGALPGGEFAQLLVNAGRQRLIKQAVNGLAHGVRLSGRTMAGSSQLDTRIIETILAVQIGTPISAELIIILLEPWPDLYRAAISRETAGWINLLQAAAARLERTLE
jgi:hypothetical protein